MSLMLMPQVLRISAGCLPPPLPPPQKISPAKTPRVPPVPMQRAMVNCYSTLHAGKGHKFYNRWCCLDSVKAKDG